MPATLEDAIAAVRAAYGDDQWPLLDATEQTRAIYREMRRLDLEETMTRRALARAAAEQAAVMGTGAGDATVAREPLRCSAFIKTRLSERCSWQPTIIHNGRAFCGFHDPQRQRAGRHIAGSATTTTREADLAAAD